jgi:hypothetical protein
MGAFRREGTFRDRVRFLEALKGALARLREGGLRGMTETWERSGDADVARLSGFGARVEFIVAASSWACAVEMPDWLPLPQSAVEAKFDEKMAPLNGL